MPNLSFLFCVRYMTIRTLSLFQYLYTNNLSDIISGQKKACRYSEALPLPLLLLRIIFYLLMNVQLWIISKTQNKCNIFRTKTVFFQRPFQCQWVILSRILHSRYFILLSSSSSSSSWVFFLFIITSIYRLSSFTSFKMIYTIVNCILNRNEMIEPNRRRLRLPTWRHCVY